MKRHLAEGLPLTDREHDAGISAKGSGRRGALFAGKAGGHSGSAAQESADPATAMAPER